MFEDSFVNMLRQYPDAISDKKRFVGLVKDMFPEQQMQVNLINTAYNFGIAEDLDRTSNITNAFAFRYVKRLVDEYGVSRMNADWAVSVWCVCYGKQILHKPCEIEINKGKTGTSPVINDEHIGGKQYNDLFQYKAVSDGYGISGFAGDNVRTLIIPNQHDGKRVTRILSGVFENCEAQEVVMTDGISVIEEGSFKNCRSLKQVIFPNTLKEIGDFAFADCCSLVTAALPKSIEQIGRYSFSNTCIRQLVLPESILWIGSGAYMKCSKLSDIQLPKHTAELPDEVFKDCISLKKIDLPKEITTIGAEAFSGCSSMIDLIVPETVTSVGENAFFGMSSSFSLICTQKSAAEQYARSHNVPFQIVL